MVGTVDDILRRPHKHQNIPGEQADHCRHDCGEEDAEPSGIGHEAAHIGVVPGPEPLGDRNGEARADADDEAVDHEVDGRGGSHRRQGVHAQGLTHDDGVHHAVELLKQHPQEHGDGEAQN